MGDPLGAHRPSSSQKVAEVLPQSEYLQEKLQQRRARSNRLKRSRHTDAGPSRIGGEDDDLFLAEAAAESRSGKGRQHGSSPLPPRPRAGSDTAAAATERRRRSQPGARELDKQMDRLTKQNFALKLELDHRREHTAKLLEQIESMRAQIERAQRIEDEHAELLRINTQLVEELEQRDKAVEEAMDIICNLEDRLSELGEDGGNSRPTTANADSGYADTDAQEASLQSSPPRPSAKAKSRRVADVRPAEIANTTTRHLKDAIDLPIPMKQRRKPSFLTDQNPSTRALRNVYMQAGKELHTLKSFTSLLTIQRSRAEDEEAAFSSPRLSVLSESSFPSIYNAAHQPHPEQLRREGQSDGAQSSHSPARPQSHNRQDGMERVSQWIADGDDAVEAPSQAKTAVPESLLPPAAPGPNSTAASPTRRPSDKSRFLSLNDALANNAATAKTRQKSEKRSPALVVGRMQPRAEHFAVREDPRAHTRAPAMSGPMFGSPLLPPTPDSASSRMLRSSRSSIVGDRALRDVAAANVNGNGINAHSTRSRLPKQSRSSLELTQMYMKSHKGVSNRQVAAYDSSDESGADDDLDSSVADFMANYNGYPDGNSLLMGTPSRFIKHPPKIPGAESVGRSSHEVTPTASAKEQTRRQLPAAESLSSPIRPPPSRAETSPAMLAKTSPFSNGGARTSEVAKSPRSVYSASSSNHTVVQADDGPGTKPRAQVTSPTGARARSKPSASPGPLVRSLSQRTHKFFRRMSNSHERSKDREPSPLPTLTTTPSSAYMDEAPNKARRRSSQTKVYETSHTPIMSDFSLLRGTHESQAHAGARPTNSSRATLTAKPTPAVRHSMDSTHTRTTTSSSVERPGETRERRDGFRRSFSFQRAEQPAAKTGTADNAVAIRARENGRRNSGQKETGGMTRRPWR